MWNTFKVIRQTYQQARLIHLTLTAALFSLQVVHLGWLFVAVVVPKLLGQAPIESPEATTLLYALADYAEIPALVSATLLYGYQLRCRPRFRNLTYLLLVNSQWVHLLWLTDDVVIRTFATQSLLVWPALAAWAAILIDYLELPVILDVFVQLRRRVSQVLASSTV